MKALILAAGLGTRLRPLTENTPKPLLPIKNKPLLLYHIESLYQSGVRDILVNTHYLPNQIHDFIEQVKSDFAGLNITVTFEESLLGSAGTLKHNKVFFDNEDFFIIVYGDNLTDINYSDLIQDHKNNDGIVTIACYTEKFPETKGIMVYDDNNKILKFIEKPKADQIISNQANSGIYVVSSEIFEQLSKLENTVLDFGFDVFPFLLENHKNMYVYKMKEFLLDIGTHESYNRVKDTGFNS